MENAPEFRPRTSQELSPASILVICGNILIVIALIFLVSTSWHSFSPLSRIVTAVVPLVILYALGFVTRKHDSEEERLSLYTIVAGSLIFPLVLGAVIFQSGLYPYTDATLFFIVSLISLLWYIIVEFMLDLSGHSVLIILAALTLGDSFLRVVIPPSYVYSILALVLAYFFLAIGWHYDREEKTEVFRANLYTYSGILLTLGGLVSLPLALGNWNLDNPDFAVWYVLGYGGVAAALFGIAIIYAKDWLSRHTVLSLTNRQLAENAAAIALTIPGILFILGGSLTEVALMTLALGMLSLAISGFVSVRSFRVLGGIAVVLGILKILFFVLTEVTNFWVIILLLIGFGLITAAYTMRHFQYKKVLEQLWQNPEKSLFGLGIAPALPARENREGNDGPVHFATHQEADQGWRIFWIIIGIIVLISILTSGIL